MVSLEERQFLRLFPCWKNNTLSNGIITGSCALRLLTLSSQTLSKCHTFPQTFPGAKHQRDLENHVLHEKHATPNTSRNVANLQPQFCWMKWMGILHNESSVMSQCSLPFNTLGIVQELWHHLQGLHWVCRWHFWDCAMQWHNAHWAYFQHQTHQFMLFDSCTIYLDNIQSGSRCRRSCFDCARISGRSAGGKQCLRSATCLVNQSPGKVTNLEATLYKRFVRSRKNMWTKKREW